MASPKTLMLQHKDLKTGEDLLKPTYNIIKLGEPKEWPPADLAGRRRKATIGAFGRERTIPPAYDFKNPKKRLKGTWVD